MQTVCIYYIQGEQKMHTPTYRMWIYTAKIILHEQRPSEVWFLSYSLPVIKKKCSKCSILASTHDIAHLKSGCLTCWCRRNHFNSILYLLFQFLDITYFWNINSRLCMPPAIKISVIQIIGRSRAYCRSASSYPLFQKNIQEFSNCKNKMCLSSIMHEPYMNTSLQIHILKQLWRNICRKSCYRALMRIGGSRVPVEQKRITDHHYSLWLIVCFTTRYHQWRVLEVLFPALTAWKLKMYTFSAFSWISRRL